MYNSPYAFSENKVTAHIELEGLEAAPFAAGLDGHGLDENKSIFDLTGREVYSYKTGALQVNNTVELLLGKQGIFIVKVKLHGLPLN